MIAIISARTAANNMAWIDLHTEIAMEFAYTQPDADIALECYCADALRRESERARDYYEICKRNPVWAQRHREQSLEEFHLAGYQRRQQRSELRLLVAGQQRLLPDDICESRQVNLHVAQFEEARKHASGTQDAARKPAHWPAQQLTLLGGKL